MPSSSLPMLAYNATKNRLIANRSLNGLQPPSSRTVGPDRDHCARVDYLEFGRWLLAREVEEAGAPFAYLNERIITRAIENELAMRPASLAVRCQSGIKVQ